MPPLLVTQLFTRDRLLIAAVVLISSACANVTLDPYNRPYHEDTLMKPGPIGGCTCDEGFDQPPYLKFGTRPLYPISHLLGGGEGRASVAISISKEGKLMVISSESAESRWFAEHVVIAMRDWQVVPAMKATKPVATTCHLQFTYKLTR